jgi:HAMP domain-containing protein
VDGVVLFVAPTYFDPQAAFTRRVSFGAGEALPIQDALQQNSGVGISLDYRSEEVMAAWTYIPSIEWGLVVKTDTAELFAPLRTMRIWTIAASVVAFLLVTVIAHWMGRSFSRPLSHLTTTAHALAHGDLTQRPSVIGSDELSQLAAAFNAVIDNLEAAVHQAEQIAQGDFTVTITPRGEQDVLGIALQQMTATLQKTADVAVTLVQGDLPDRLIEKGERDLLTHALNGMIDKLRELAEQAEQIAAGEYAMIAAPRGQHDQLGLALQKMVRELRAVTAENAERLWRAHGRAQLSEQLHGDLDLQQMAQRAIHFLCRYLELPIGALYVRGEDDSFRLTASFAFQRRKGLPKTFKPGVGLVGQAAQAAETLLVEQLPDDYFPLQSAWTAGPPQTVLLQPCRAAGVVECVLELGNFTEWTPAQQTFLAEVSELIAVSLNVAKGLAERERMREALQAHERLIKEQKTEIARQKVLLHEKMNN